MARQPLDMEVEGKTGLAQPCRQRFFAEGIPMADSSEQVGQNEIEELLRRAQGAPSTTPAASSAASPSATPSEAALGQEEIEALLRAGASRPAAASARSAAASQPGSASEGAAAATNKSATADIDFLLNQAEQALASINSPTPPDMLTGATPFRLVDFAGGGSPTDVATLDLIRDVELDLRIELGRTHMYLEDVLKLAKGAVVPLDKLAGDPVDIYVNGRLIARGEVLILNDNFCVRVAELVASEGAA